MNIAKPNIPIEYNRSRFVDIFNHIIIQLNNLSSGFIVATTNSMTAAPTTGTYVVGDFIKNSTPSELGSASSKYIITGWVCTVSGTPGTWLECRTLTGN